LSASIHGQYGIDYLTANIVSCIGSRILPHLQTATPLDGGSGKGRAADVTEPASAAKTSTKEQPRTQTPVPLGLQDFPPLVAPQPRSAPSNRITTSSQVTKAAIKPVVPVVPAPLNPTANTIKDAQSTQAGSETQGAAKADKPPKPSEPVAEIDSAGKLAAADPKINQPKASAGAPPKVETDISKDPLPDMTRNKAGKIVDKRQPPAKIDVSAAKNATGVDLGKAAKAVSKNQKPSETSTTTQQAAFPRPSRGQPNTPTESIEKASPISGGRSAQPRTLNVVPTSHTENTPKVGSASPSVPGTPSTVNKPLSRRPSLTSIHAPGTPVSEKISENASVTSTSMSRANSPPPSKVGTAPVRHITKSQQKKERQARAKQAEDVSKSEAAPVKPIAEESEIAPIIGRKKKTKKPKNATDSTPAVTRPTSPVPADKVTEEKQQSQTATPLKALKDDMRNDTPMTETSREPESPATPDVASSNEQTKASLTAVSILASLQKAGELKATVQELFKGVPGLNQRFDIPANEYPHSPSLPPLSEAQRALLDQGIPVHIEFKHNKRMIVLPDRTTLSHLSKEQAQRYVALHRSITLTSEHFADVFFTASRQEPKVLQMHPPRNTPKGPDDGHTLANRFGNPPALDHTPAGHPILPATYPVDDKMGPQRPIMQVEDAERVLMATRKETEAMEKKLNALMRKNRRMMFGGH